ncbi:hypothetical protein PoB_005829400 [Plakobranchus ocellatus]|uniref:Uncharacterized protein n=1 Tax=Plakobranchus ocellatus TaxID=259542 RepID=A0AAV4CGC3_9GAST|nr:hypothetical protein PoB_005829400 [Plakobranchus ocellatus]
MVCSNPQLKGLSCSLGKFAHHFISNAPRYPIPGQRLRCHKHGPQQRPVVGSNHGVSSPRDQVYYPTWSSCKILPSLLNSRRRSERLMLSSGASASPGLHAPAHADDCNFDQGSYNTREAFCGLEAQM